MLCLNSSFGQKKLFEEVISKGEKYGDYYLLHISGNKNYSVEDIQDFCEENSYKCIDFKTKSIQRFGGYKNVVTSFLFISNKELEKYTEIDKVNSAEYVRILLAKYPSDHLRIEEKFLKYCIIKIKSGDINFINEFDNAFPLSSNYKSLELDLSNTIQNSSSITNLNIVDFINKIPNKKNVVNTNFDLKNENELGTFFASFQTATKLSLETQNNIIFKMLDAVPKILTKINLDYERREFEKSKLDNNVNSIRNFLTRFPNTSLKADAKSEINKLDEQNWKTALSINTVEGYNDYRANFENGLYAEKAKQKSIKIINDKFEEENKRIEKLEQEAQNEKRKDAQRIQRIKSADIGDKLCFTFRHEEFFFGVKTKSIMVSVVCFIEAINKDRYRVTVSDYQTQRYEYYDLVPVINGVKFNKNEIKWVKPFEDSRWQICE